MNSRSLTKDARRNCRKICFRKKILVGNSKTCLIEVNIIYVESTKQIRSGFPVVAQSAYASASEIEEIMLAVFCRKPANRHKLALEQYFYKEKSN